MKNNDFSSPEDMDDFSSFDPDEVDDERDALDSDGDVSEERRYWQERFEDDDDYDSRHRDRKVKKKGKFRDKESD